MGVLRQFLAIAVAVCSTVVLFVARTTILLSLAALDRIIINTPGTSYANLTARLFRAPSIIAMNRDEAGFLAAGLLLWVAYALVHVRRALRQEQMLLSALLIEEIGKPVSLFQVRGSKRLVPAVARSDRACFCTRQRAPRGSFPHRVARARLLVGV